MTFSKICFFLMAVIALVNLMPTAAAATVAADAIANKKLKKNAEETSVKQTIQQQCYRSWNSCHYYRGTVGDCEQHRGICRACLQACTGVNNGLYHHCFYILGAICNH